MNEIDLNRENQVLARDINFRFRRQLLTHTTFLRKYRALCRRG